jgi:hypothetical protein
VSSSREAVAAFPVLVDEVAVTEIDNAGAADLAERENGATYGTALSDS